MTSISCHVLDTTLGLPAIRVAVKVERVEEGAPPRVLTTRVTDADGRVSDLWREELTAVRELRVTFDTGAYMLAQKRAVFYPRVEVTFLADPAVAHYHIPLIMSPFGYSTYRGS